MDEITIFWTHTALEQRNYIFEYWNNRNKSSNYSRKLNSSILDRIGLLKGNPEMGVKTNVEGTRAISLGHYSLLYQVNFPRILITGFWDNRQDPKKLLKFLNR
jgi:toxin YoeB